MRYYPVFLNLKDKRTIVIGGGDVAERKVLSLIRAGASVTVVSPTLTDKLSSLKDREVIEHIGREYREGDLEGAFLVIAATSDMKVNQKVFADAGNIPVNVVDVPDLCSFIVPSVVERGPLTIAVSTSGISPALSKTIRKELEDIYPEGLVEFLEHLSRIRDDLKRSGLPEDERTGILKSLGSRKVLEILREEGAEGAIDYLKEILPQDRSEPSS